MSSVLSSVREFMGADRLAERERIKAELAIMEGRKARLKHFDNELASLDARDDQAVQAHQETCAPIQAALAEIERKIGQHLVNRTPLPSHLEEDRSEQMQLLKSANEQLERETEAIRKQRTAIEKTRDAVRLECAGITVLRNELSKVGVACPQLLIRQHIAEQSLKWLQERSKAASAQCQQWRYEVEKFESKAAGQRTNLYGNPVQKGLDQTDTEMLRIMRARLERWTAEYQTAAELIAEAMQESAAIHQQILDE